METGWAKAILSTRTGPQCSPGVHHNGLSPHLLASIFQRLEGNYNQPGLGELDSMYWYLLFDMIYVPFLRDCD